jgi:hypothetical protein
MIQKTNRKEEEIDLDKWKNCFKIKLKLNLWNQSWSFFFSIYVIKIQKNI